MNRTNSLTTAGDIPLPMNPTDPVGTRSTASQTRFRNMGTRWNASLSGSGVQCAKIFSRNSLPEGEGGVRGKRGVRIPRSSAPPPGSWKGEGSREKGANSREAFSVASPTKTSSLEVHGVFRFSDASISAHDGAFHRRTAPPPAVARYLPSGEKARAETGPSCP